MALDKDTLSRLDPESRLLKLRQMDEERKKDVLESDDLRKRAEAELQRTRDIPKVEVPKLEPVDISKMFAPEEGLDGIVKSSKEGQKEHDDVAAKYFAQAEYRETTKPSAYQEHGGHDDYRTLHEDLDFGVQPISRHKQMYRHH